MNKDQVQGQFNQAIGHIKETTGKIIGDKTIESKGKIQNYTGIIQERYGDFRADLKHRI
jgi:uncharacterized protein YjbJ (UPF0337 family)